jgi:Rieske 2Fe-2S family protein
MTTVEHKWSALPVPYAIEVPDRVRKERYYDPDFYAMEAELVWPRVWQMACRLEEIPEAGDFAEYEILDQSVIVIRTDDLGVRAFQNVCRHRGVRLAQGRGSRRGGFVCPFHGWCYGPDGHNTRVTQPGAFSEHNLQTPDLDLTPVRCEAWGGCAWINLDDDAPPLRECTEPSATVLDGWKAESTGSWPKKLSSSSTTCCRRTRSCASPAAFPVATTPTSILAPSSRPSCNTCAR